MLAQVVDLHILRRDHVRPRDVEAVVHLAQRLVRAHVHAGHRRLLQPHHEAVHVVFPAPLGGKAEGARRRKNQSGLGGGSSKRDTSGSWQITALDEHTPQARPLQASVLNCFLLCIIHHTANTLPLSPRGAQLQKNRRAAAAPSNRNRSREAAEAQLATLRHATAQTQHGRPTLTDCGKPLEGREGGTAVEATGTTRHATRDTQRKGGGEAGTTHRGPKRIMPGTLQMTLVSSIELLSTSLGSVLRGRRMNCIAARM